MRSFLFPIFFACLFFPVFHSCSDQAEPSVHDLSSTPPADAAVKDAADYFGDGPIMDAAPDRGRDAFFSEAGLAVSCAGACAQQSLSATFEGVTEPLERSIYGVDRDAAGDPGLYLEALHGGFAGCPEENSPSTERTLVVSGLPLPRSGPPVTLAEGLVVSLLDFTGTLLPSSPVSKATAASVTFVAAEVCPDCIPPLPPNQSGGFVALELSATFPGGTVSGHIYAVHCVSLDL